MVVRCDARQAAGGQRIREDVTGWLDGSGGSRVTRSSSPKHESAGGWLVEGRPPDLRRTLDGPYC